MNEKSSIMAFRFSADDAEMRSVYSPPGTAHPAACVTRDCLRGSSEMSLRFMQKIYVASGMGERVLCSRVR